LFVETDWFQVETPLSKPVLSIYPGFVDLTNLMIIDEDHNSDQPTVIVYDIEPFLPKPEEENP
jgi:hypothetical protein